MFIKIVGGDVWVIQWAKSRSRSNEFDVPIPNFAKVTDKLFRGALPDFDGYRALAEKLDVYRVCSMIEHESQDDRKLALSAGIKEWRYIPFSDRDAPEPKSVKEWLDYVRSAKKKGAIFTHCRGGRHRTGTLVAVFRVVDCGWTKERAFEEMLRYGWYGALGHEPLLEWFFDEFDPKDYSVDSETRLS
ncbi:MAG TPA: protein-tyrosine phosphatase family protein [Blastocatellia bacterium]|nr:protein-tyrosine phosphatase family protein [Blastocatellia bacterium]